MTVHVGQLTSDVVPEPDTGGTAGAGGARPAMAGTAWEETDRYRAMQCWLAEVAARTRAEAFDD